MKTKNLVKQFVITSLPCFITAVSFAQNTPPPKQWDYRFGGYGYTDNRSDDLSYVKQTSDGSYILGGTSNSPKNGDKSQYNWGDTTFISPDFWIVKTDANGIKQWDRRFGGLDHETLFAMQQTYDHGYILGGWSSSTVGGDRTAVSWDWLSYGYGADDYWIIKIDSNGVKQWDNAYGGDNYDRLFALQQTKDSGYILGGSSEEYLYRGDKMDNRTGGWIVKVNSKGVKQWDKAFTSGSPQPYDDNVASIQQTSDGGYILVISTAGHTNSCTCDNTNIAKGGRWDYWVIKTDANGVKQWDKEFGGSADDIAHSIKQTVDGGFIVGGSSYSGISGDKTQASKGGSDYWIVKMDANGNKLWDSSYGGAGDDFFESIESTQDGGYILGGTSSSCITGDKTQGTRGSNDIWIVKINTNGVKQWDARFGGTLSEGGDFYNLSSLAASQTQDGGYIAGNSSNSRKTGDKTQANWDKRNISNDYWVVKLAPEGTTQTFYRDFDGDGYGNHKKTTTASAKPAGYVTDDEDCTDSNFYTHPCAADICDGIDNNCNGVVDENSITATTNYTGQVNSCSSSPIVLTASGGTDIIYQWLKNGKKIKTATDNSYTVRKSGDYRVIETNNICTDTSAIVSVTVLQSPSATITALGSLDICSTGSVVLQANSGTGLTYQWLKGTSNISGATNRSYTASTIGTYKVRVTGSNGCYTTSKGVKVTNSCGKISDESLSQSKALDELSVYPNPTTGNISIQYNNNSSGKIQLNVYDAVGKKVFAQSAASIKGNNTYQLNLSNVATGVYYLELINNEEKSRIKFVIEK